MSSETLSAIRAIVEEWNNGQCSPRRAMHSIDAIASIIEGASIAVQPPAASQPGSNTPIEELLDEYTEECGEFTDLNDVKRASLLYVETMPDSHVRCLLYTLAATQPPAASQPTTRNPNAISLSLVMALNEATGSNEWQGDATASELLAPAIEAIRALAAVKGEK